MINRMLKLAFILLMSSCCSLNEVYDANPTTCQCKKFNTLVNASFVQPTTEQFNYYSINKNISRDSLMTIILQNKNCWIGKSFDYVKKQLPAPSKTFGRSLEIFYGAMEDINCQGGKCVTLHIYLKEKPGRNIVTLIEAVKGNSAIEGVGIMLYSTPVN